jgi:hypothetical protein
MAKQTQTAPTASSQYVAALAVLADLQKRDDLLRDQELARMKRGERIDAEAALGVSATEQAAAALLAGQPFPAPRRGRSYLDLLAERAAIRRAIELGRDQADRLRLAAAGERLAARQDELREIGKQMVWAVIGLDRVLRARDALVNEIGMPPASLSVEAWPLAGRLSNTASQAYRLCEVGVQNGWLTQRELDQEYELARKADAWR